jgi:hypothetical protein
MPQRLYIFDDWRNTMMVAFVRHNKALLAGSFLWCGLLVFLAVIWLSSDNANSGPAYALGQVTDFWLGSRKSVPLRLPNAAAKHGDPIFLLTPTGQWKQVGYLQQVQHDSNETEAIAVWFDADHDPYFCQFEFHENRGSLGDVVRTMFPPEKRLQLESLIGDAIKEHGEAISAQLQPIIVEAMQESLPIIESSLRESLHRHRPEIERLGERYRKTIVNDKLLPMIRTEVMPVVQTAAEPLARQIGRELWDRASLWRFGWRAIYDKAPLTNRDLVRREFERFVREEATPVITSHTDDILAVQQRILLELANDPEVRRELGDVGRLLVNDQDLRTLLRAILREVLVENQQLRAVWLQMWSRQETQHALRLTSERLEPIVRKIGDELFGTREGGVSPSFARVLRNQILGKDKRWLVAVPNEGVKPTPVGERIPVQSVRDDSPYPLIVLANPNNA